MKISEFLQTDGVNYASYDNYRKIASCIDGCKVSMRKCLYTFLKNDIKAPRKVEQLQSMTAEQTSYIHGAQSLGGVIVSMAQEFPGANNMPWFKREGTFGTRLIPAAAAGRYIFTCKEDWVDKVYRKEDTRTLEEQIWEGDRIEPKYYVPVLPMLLVNGSLGLTTGFQQKILPRNPKECLNWIEKRLDGKFGKSGKAPEPWFNGFQGDICQSKRGAGWWIISGKIRKIGRNKIEIYQLPLDYTLEKYIDVLEGLEEAKEIRDYTDLSQDGVFKFQVTLWSQAGKGIQIDDEDILEKLKLVSSVSENYTSLDEDNRVVEFNSPEEILEHYFQVRLRHYELRRQCLLGEIAAKLKEMVSRYLFVKGVVEKTIQISEVPDEKITEQLDAQPKIFRIDDSYDYLLGMPIRQLTKTKYEQLKAQIQALKGQYDRLKTLTPEEMWKTDLAELKPLLKDY